jgi:hypothetical protein
MAGRKHALPIAFQLGRIEIQRHQLVDTPAHQHIAVKQDDAIVLDERERNQFGPRVVKPRIVYVASTTRRLEERHATSVDLARIQRCQSFSGHGVGVQRYKGILRADASQRML